MNLNNFDLNIKILNQKIDLTIQMNETKRNKCIEHQEQYITQMDYKVVAYM